MLLTAFDRAKRIAGLVTVGNSASAQKDFSDPRFPNPPIPEEAAEDLYIVLRDFVQQGVDSCSQRRDNGSVSKSRWFANDEIKLLARKLDGLEKRRLMSALYLLAIRGFEQCEPVFGQKLWMHDGKGRLLLSVWAGLIAGRFVDDRQFWMQSLYALAFVAKEDQATPLSKTLRYNPGFTKTHLKHIEKACRDLDLASQPDLKPLLQAILDQNPRVWRISKLAEQKRRIEHLIGIKAETAHDLTREHRASSEDYHTENFSGRDLLLFHQYCRDISQIREKLRPWAKAVWAKSGWARRETWAIQLTDETIAKYDIPRELLVAPGLRNFAREELFGSFGFRWHHYASHHIGTIADEDARLVDEDWCRHCESLEETLSQKRCVLDWRGELPPGLGLLSVHLGDFSADILRHLQTSRGLGPSKGWLKRLDVIVGHCNKDELHDSALLWLRQLYEKPVTTEDSRRWRSVESYRAVRSYALRLVREITKTIEGSKSKSSVTPTYFAALGTILTYTHIPWLEEEHDGLPIVYYRQHDPSSLSDFNVAVAKGVIWLLAQSPTEAVVSALKHVALAMSVPVYRSNMELHPRAIHVSLAAIRALGAMARADADAALEEIRHASSDGRWQREMAKVL